MVKAMIVGGTMTVPGASGGTMAMILGIYEDLIAAVGNLPRLLADWISTWEPLAGKKQRHSKAPCAAGGQRAPGTRRFLGARGIPGSQSILENLCFLALFSAGALAGMALLANGVLALLERYPVVVSYFFLGAVAGGIPLICRQAQVKKMTWQVLFWPLAGLFVVYGLAALPEGLFAAGLSGGSRSGEAASRSPGAKPQSRKKTRAGLSGGSPVPGGGAFGTFSLSRFLFQFLGGCVLAVALILPGISVSQMLLMLGLYEPVMAAVSQLRFLSLVPLGLGAVLCTLLVTRLLGKAMQRRPQPTYLLILGFVLGSLGELYPGPPAGWNLLFAPLAAAAGYQLLSRLSRRAG